MIKILLKKIYPFNKIYSEGLISNLDIIKNLKKRNFFLKILLINEVTLKRRLLILRFQNIIKKKKIFSEIFNISKNKFISYYYIKKDNKLNKIKLKLILRQLDKVNGLLSLMKLYVPNLINKSVPYGVDNLSNVEVRKLSIRSKKKTIKFRDNLINLSKANIISGSGFTLLENDFSSLYRAIGNYMLDLHVKKHNYNLVISPLMVNTKAMINSGHLPKFSIDQFKIEDEDLWMIPTSEVVLGNMIYKEKIKIKTLPIKYVSKTECFRREKGKYGSQVKGMIRQHQFEKVELFQIVEPNLSYLTLEEMCFQAETVLNNFKIPYRTVILSSGDIGFSSAKTYDIEAWMPISNFYLEVSSCSNTTDFQTSRMNAKVNELSLPPHSLNCSGLAIGRVFLSIIENYYEENTIKIPEILKQYMHGKNEIKLNKQY